MTAPYAAIVIGYVLLAIIFLTMILRATYVFGRAAGYRRAREEYEGDEHEVMMFHAVGLGAEARKAQALLPKTIEGRGGGAGNRLPEGTGITGGGGGHLPVEGKNARWPE